MSRTSFHTFNEAGVANSPALILLRKTYFRIRMSFGTMCARSGIFPSAYHLDRDALVLRVPNAVALFAPPTEAVFGFMNSVASIYVRMTSFAVRLFTVKVRIFSMRDLPQVIRVAARSISAFVMDFHSVYQLSDEQDECGLVSATHLFVKLKDAVSSIIFRSSPVPTPRFSVQFNVFYESLNQWFIWWHKKAADSCPLNWRIEAPRAENRLLKLLFSIYSKAVQSLFTSLQKGLT